jgi:hypothetical protein
MTYSWYNRRLIDNTTSQQHWNALLHLYIISETIQRI